MSKQYNVFHAIIASVYSAELYRDVATRWQGYALRYLFVLTFILVTPVSIVGVIFLNDALFAREVNQPNLAELLIAQTAEQVPKLEFRGSKMRVIDTERHMIYIGLGGENVPIAMIDHDATEADFTEDGPVFILGRDNLYIQKTAGGSIETRTWESMGVYERYVDPVIIADWGAYYLKQFEEYRPRVMVIAGVIIWCFALLIMFFWRVIQSFIYGVVAIGLSSLMNNRLDFISAARLSAIAITPAILLDVVLALTVQDTMMWPLFAVITIGYLTFAIRSIQAIDEPEQS